MPLYADGAFASDAKRSASSETEYRTSFMSPRREDYIPHVTLPKLNSARPLTRSQSFFGDDLDSNTRLNSSEYRLCFPNHRPKRPYVFHARASHVFDYVPMPLATKASPKLQSHAAYLKNTEYHERFPNYRSYIPSHELVPPHFSPQPDVPSATKLKKDRMSRSQYFHELVTNSDKENGGQRQFGNSEQRAAFQWPQRIQQKFRPVSSSTMALYEHVQPSTYNHQAVDASN